MHGEWLLVLLVAFGFHPPTKACLLFTMAAQPSSVLRFLFHSRVIQTEEHQPDRYLMLLHLLLFLPRARRAVLFLQQRTEPSQRGLRVTVQPLSLIVQRLKLFTKELKW